MDNHQKILNMLGLTRRANKLVFGFESVIESIRAGKCKLVFLADDTLDNTKKAITDKCLTYTVKVIKGFTSNEISLAIGKNNIKVIGILDDSFKRAIEMLL